MRRRIDDDDEDCSSRRRGVGSAAVAVVSSSATRSGAVLPLSSPVLIAATARDATTTTVPNAPPRGTPIQPAAGGAANADRLKTDQSLAFRRVIGVDFGRHRALTCVCTRGWEAAARGSYSCCMMRRKKVLDRH